MKDNLEQTLVIFKPDALRRKLVGEIMNRFERVGLELTALKTIRFTEELCREHYQHLVEEFLPGDCALYDVRPKHCRDSLRIQSGGGCSASGRGYRPAGGCARYD